MATFFGEVILPSSRVFFDEDDSDFEDDITTKSTSDGLLELLELTPQSLSPEYEILIITEGNVSKAFADNYLLEPPPKPIAELRLKKDESKEPMDVEVKPPKTQSSFIYSLDKNARLLTISPAVDITQANDLVLKDFINKSKTVIILCNRPSADFRCDSINDLPPAFLRALHTSNLPAPEKFLEQPNFISGSPAAVLSYCECVNKDCQLYVVYMDKAVADSVTLSPYVELFNKSTRLQSLSKKRNIKNSASTDQSFMYM